MPTTEAAVDPTGWRSPSPGGFRRMLRARAVGVLLLLLLTLRIGPGCGSNPPPTAIPPTGDSPKESEEVRAKNPLITRD